MQRIDPSADELGLDWGEDTIYCEATCRPEDILYEGSDDEDYDNPVSRKLRYEAAGQRYLDGKTPFLLTALLKGPFDAKADGWVNPWRSKHRTSGTSQGVRTSPGKLTRSARVKRNVSIPETIQPAPHDSLECHLPSPESLKQASVTEAHPYLEEDELAIVQEWRSTVEPTEGARDRFWASTPQGTQAERKRKARGSSWLKLLASKRRRTDVMESGSVNTPVRQRSHPTTFTGDEMEIVDAPNTSFNSVPDRLPSSAIAAGRYFSASQNGDWDRDTGIVDLDELTDPVHESSTPAFTSSIKRISPVREIGKIGRDKEAKDAEDELSRDKFSSMQAAASLSSPISQRQSAPGSHRSINSSQHSDNDQSTSKSKALPQRRNSGNDIAGGHNAPVAPEGSDTSEALPAFETQEDQSFCFKRRPRTTDAGHETTPMQISSSPEGLRATADEDSWSGLSSLDAEADDQQLLQVDCSLPSLPAGEGDADTTASSDSRNELVEFAAHGLTSDLSSISSQQFTGFDLSGASHHDAGDMEVASDTSRIAESDTASVTSDNSVNEVIRVADAQTFGQAQDQGLEPQKEEIHVAAEDDIPAQDHDAPVHVDETTQDSDDQEENDDGDDATAVEIPPSATPVSNKTSQVIPQTPRIETSPSKLASSQADIPLSSPSHARSLLKASVKRFIPESSWSKLSHLTGSPIRSPSRSQRTQSVTRSPANTTIANNGSSQNKLATPNARSQAIDSGCSDKRAAPTPSPVSKSKNVAQTPSSTNPSADVHATPSFTQHLEGNQTLQYVQDRIEIDPPSPKEDQAVSISQQSPWAKSKLSQYASLAMDQLPPNDSPQTFTPPNKGQNLVNTASPNTQTPWTEETTRLPMMRTPIDQATPMETSVPNNTALASAANTQLQDVSTAATPAATPAYPARGATPEPQFSVKSFASFMSPSPERRRLRNKRSAWRDSGSRLPSTQGILASATKNPWDYNSSQRRVSWAPLPHETEGLSSLPVTPSPSLSRGRQGSPPPATPIAELPTSEDAKFHEHFNAVARRTNLARSSAVHQRLLPSESQRTVGSPAPDAMAEAFLTADQIRQPSRLADQTKSKIETEESQDPLDMVEDVFREMGDFLEKWNVDNIQAPEVAQGVQSPW
ncbi:protamine p1 [Fusarium albosuccineum]|uniref:Protamine p1 n=1 Tax=Fusarium albosuccineum TaxID=1237068 RepID=A0A8H4LKV3_9HYPO|nr:protamine p1 [Fusarium albosuccineum]